MNHLEFAAAESAALDESDWERWIFRVEQLCGHPLDGDQATDGYSLDSCYDMFRAGLSDIEAARLIPSDELGD